MGRGWKWSEMVGSGRKWSEVVKNGQKWSEMVRSGLLQKKIAENESRLMLSFHQTLEAATYKVPIPVHLSHFYIILCYVLLNHTAIAAKKNIPVSFYQRQRAILSVNLSHFYIIKAYDMLSCYI